MISRRDRLKLLVVAGFGAVACCVVAASAYGFVQVYGNNFNNRPQYRQVKTITESNKCKRVFKESRKVMEIRAEEGPGHCRFKPPVQGSNPQPNYRFDAAAKLTTGTPGPIRPDSYISASLRVGGGKRYELRVFPKTRDYELRRRPQGAPFPENGSSGAIKGVGNINKLRLQAEGQNLRAYVNGTEIVNVNDGNHTELRGAKVEFGVGNTHNTKKPTVATFDRLRVSVPTP